MILTWVCQRCGWANDNNSGPCRKCGAAGGEGGSGMAKQSPTYRDFNPTNDERVDWIKGQVDGLIENVRAAGDASGPKTRRMTALAITNFEQGSMWAVKALFCEDAIKGDDGGAKGPDRSRVPAEDHDGQSDP